MILNFLKKQKNYAEKELEFNLTSFGAFNRTIDFDEHKYGYSKEQVDRYIKELSDEYNAMYEQYVKLERDNMLLKDNTEAIGRVLLNAEISAKQILDRARREADRIIENAKEKAEIISKSEYPFPEFSIIPGEGKPIESDLKLMDLSDIDYESNIIIENLLKEVPF